MINRRQENYHRLQVVLKWMLAVNLLLAGIVLVLFIRNISLSRQVSELTAQLEADMPNFGKSTEGSSPEEQGTEAQTEVPTPGENESQSQTTEADVTLAEPTGADSTETSTEPKPTEQETTPPATEEAVDHEKRNFIVCLDAGHGGPGGKGAISTLDGRYESHDTLKLMLAVRDALQSYGDVTVVVTRDTDVEVDNGVRAQIANDANADVFVSFHRNSNVAGDRGGIEGWIHSSNPSDSREVGERILSAMEKVGVVHNYGVKSGTWDEPEANYKIIRLAEMPAVLLEVGYLNFQRDNDLFDRYYEEYAEAAAGAIYGWLRDTVVR
jgi:N-acetylmuramoyl-L-alanine amidase